jgi:Nidogen-like
MLSKWKEWIGVKSRAKAKRAAPSRLRPRLELEQLETRMVPAAVRMLPGFTTTPLPANDDNSSPAVTIPFTLNFFGVTTSTLFVNNNGNITFNQPLGQFTPSALNTANGGIPIIAPFFADVDTTGAGSNVVTYGTDTLCGRQVFGVDYINVGYFAGHVDKLNSFQVILVDRSDTGAGNFDIEFNYDQIQWETGDASGGANGLGGQSARVGYSNGSGTAGTFFELPGSGVNGALLDGGPNALISTTLEASTPGRLHFLVRNGVVVTTPPVPAVNNDVTLQTRIFAPFRYITDDLGTGLQHGNLTLINFTAPITPAGTGTAATDACLDITTTSSTPTMVTPTAFPGPITVVFRALPSNVTIVNATGFTASGLAFITEPIASLPANAPPLRVRINIANSLAPRPNAPTTFFESVLEGMVVQVFSGPFDPTTL